MPIGIFVALDVQILYEASVQERLVAAKNRLAIAVKPSRVLFKKTVTYFLRKG